MGRRIDIEVGLGGRLKMEFSGFLGDACFDEADALSKALKELGLWAIPVTVTTKSSAQQEAEIGMTENEPTKVVVG